MAKRTNFLDPNFPSFTVDDKDRIETIKRMGLHYCKKQMGDPSYGPPASIVDCIEDLKGRLILRVNDIGTQVTFCPFCGKKARSRP